MQYILSVADAWPFRRSIGADRAVGLKADLRTLPLQAS